jgi:hypothetical protein
LKLTNLPVLAVNAAWSAGVGDPQLTVAESLRAAGTSSSSATAATNDALAREETENLADIFLRVAADS